jgi:hypothetical protein
VITPLPAPKVLDAFYLEARARLLDLAAILDRIGRGADAAELNRDPRLAKIRQALKVLHDAPEKRAEQIQRLFSLEYEAGWERPEPR